MATMPTTTQVNTWFPGRSILINLGLAFGGSLITALAAQISIHLPFTPVPITGQTFAVLIMGGLLGSRLGALTQIFYLAEGSLGLPFFAAGKGGLGILFGPTGGYLIGFPIAAFIIGFLIERGWNNNILSLLLAMIVAEAAIFGLGLLILSLYIPSEKLLMAGLIPFLPGVFLKDAVAIIILWNTPRDSS